MAPTQEAKMTCSQDECRSAEVEVLAAGGSGIVAATHGGRLQITASETSVKRVCGAAVSTEGSLVCAITLDKDVIVLSRAGDGNWNEVAKHSLPKRLTDVCFSAEGDSVVVADGFGDVYQLPVKGSLNVRDESEQGQALLLGHVSTVTAIDIFESTIASADRDSKLRVSHFPKSFIIESFCLGHEDFITCVKWVNGKRLLSGSGDGTVRLWNAVNGELVDTLVVRDHIPEHVRCGKDIIEQIVVSSIVVAPKGRDIAVFSAHGKPWLFVVSGLSTSIQLLEVVIVDKNCAISGVDFDDTTGLWVSCTSKDRVTKYTLCRSSSTSEAVHLKRVEGFAATAKDADIDFSHVSRFDWLTLQRKKEMVSDWKGKKRRHGEI